MSIIQKTDPEICYEITPFREESGYADNRHPDQIVRSHDLLADSCRRDFTINALYRIPYSDSPIPTSLPGTLKDDTQFLSVLTQHGGCILIDTHTIILQDHAFIRDFLHTKTLPILPCYTQSEQMVS